MHCFPVPPPPRPLAQAQRQGSPATATAAAAATAGAAVTATAGAIAERVVVVGQMAPSACVSAACVSAACGCAACGCAACASEWTACGNGWCATARARANERARHAASQRQRVARHLHHLFAKRRRMSSVCKEHLWAIQCIMAWALGRMQGRGPVVSALSASRTGNLGSGGGGRVSIRHGGCRWVSQSVDYKPCQIAE